MSARPAGRMAHKVTVRTLRELREHMKGVIYTHPDMAVREASLWLHLLRTSSTAGTARMRGFDWIVTRADIVTAAAALHRFIRIFAEDCPAPRARRGGERVSAAFTLAQIGALMDAADAYLLDLAEIDAESGHTFADIADAREGERHLTAGIAALRDLTVTVRIENHAPSGTESVIAVVLAPNGGAPMDLHTLLHLDEWWEEHVFPHTGGNGATVVEATIERAADVGLIGRRYVWEG